MQLNHVCFHVSEKPRRPQDSVLCVFLRVGEAKGTDSYVFSRAAPEGLAGAPGGPRMAFHTVGETPEAESYVFSRAGEAQRAWQGLGRVWQGCRWSPGGPKRPQEWPGSRFIRVFTCLSGGPRGLRSSSLEWQVV